MHFSNTLIWLAMGVTATEWPDVVTVTTTQTQYAPWGEIVYRDGDVCYCPLEMSTTRMASQSTLATATSAVAADTDIVVNPGGSSCLPTKGGDDDDNDLGSTASVSPLTPGQSTLATSQIQSEAHVSSSSASTGRRGIIPPPPPTESRSLPDGRSSGVKPETTPLHPEETTRDGVSTASCVSGPSYSQTVVSSQATTTRASLDDSTPRTGSVVPSVSSRSGEDESSRQPVSSARPSQAGSSSSLGSSVASSLAASFTTKPQSEGSRQPTPYSLSIPGSAWDTERLSSPSSSTPASSSSSLSTPGSSSLKPASSSTTLSSPTLSQPGSSNTLMSLTRGSSRAPASSMPGSSMPDRSSQALRSSQPMSSAGSSSQERSSSPVSSPSSEPASTSLSSSNVESSSAPISSKMASSSKVSSGITSSVNTVSSSTSVAVISWSSQPSSYSSKHSSAVSSSSSGKTWSKHRSSTPVSSSANTTPVASPSGSPSKTSSVSKSTKYTSCVPTAAFAVEDSAKLAATSVPEGLVRRGPVEVFGRAECSPGTFRCISKPSGWEACDTQGKWIFAGVCPPATYCVYYPEDLGLLCLPPC